MANNDVGIIKRASDYGAYMGAVLCIIFFAVVYSTIIPQLSILAIALIAVIPFFLFWMMRRTRKVSGAYTRLSALWMFGILTFIFGGIILAAVVYIYLQFIDTDFISRQLGAAIEIYKQNPELVNSETLDTLTKIYESGQVPTAIQSAMSSLWSVSFFGSVLSLIEAAIVTAASKNNIGEK